MYKRLMYYSEAEARGGLKTTKYNLKTKKAYERTRKNL